MRAADITDRDVKTAREPPICPVIMSCRSHVNGALNGVFCAQG
jgi:hypothetical protein